MTKTADQLTADRARELVSFDPETGVFVNRINRGNQIKVGSVLGSVSGNGYRLIALDGRRYNAHRVAWLYVYGQWPAGQIDHINGDKLDNRIANLRDVTPSVNRENMRASPKSASLGILGVHKTRDSLRNPYQARIKVKGKQRSIGYFTTPEAAHAAYLHEKRRLHAGCTI